MAQAVIACFSNNKFFRTLDFQPKPHNGGIILHNRVAKKTFAADQYTVTVTEDDHRSSPSSSIHYTFSTPSRKYVAFFMDPDSGKCISISGDEGTQPGIMGLRCTHREQNQLVVDQDSIDSILDNFLTDIKNVYTGQDFENLAQGTIQKLPFLFPPTPGIAPPSP